MEEAAISKQGLFRGYQGLALLTALLLIVQPILIGQSLYNDSDYLDIHAMVGNFVFISVVAQTVVCFLGRSKWGFTTVVWNLVLVAFVVAQIGLGYSDSSSSSEVHLPLGVLIFGLGLITAQLAFFDIKRQR